MEVWQLLATLLVSVVSMITVLGGLLADLVVSTTAKQHMRNPHWPPHAKFHNGQTICLGVLLGLLALCILWYPGGDLAGRFHLGVIIAALYWLAMIGASLLPGTRWVDPEFVKDTRLVLKMPPQLFLACFIFILLIISEMLFFL